MNNSVVLLKTELRDILQKLLSYEESETFMADESEVLRIEKFIDTKQIFFDKIKEIEQKVDVAERLLIQKEPEEEAIDKECKDLIRKILDIEENNKKIFDNISKDLLNNVKNLKHRQKFSTGYYTAAFDFRGDRFDAKQ